MVRPVSEWEAAERVQKNAAGQYRAFIGGQWVPVEKAQKNATGQFRVMRGGMDAAPAPAPAPASSPNTDTAPGLGSQLMRQLGLTARYGIEGVTGLGDLLAEPIRMGMRQVLPDELKPQGSGGSAIADMLHLPKPETPGERIVGSVSTALAGGGGTPKIAELGAKGATGATKLVMEALASRPALQFASSAGAGAGSGIAHEAGLGPYGEIAAGLLGGISVPAAGAGLKAIGGKAENVAATAGAAFGNDKAVTHLTRDAVDRLVGPDRSKIVEALQGATEYVPGAKPTVAEAIVEAQQGKPEQFGGRIVRLQKDLSGARGVEDVLPTAAKEQQAALQAERMRIEAELGPKRAAALEAANAGGVRSGGIINAIDALRSQPGIRANKTAQSALDEIVKDIEKNAQGSAHGGIIEANDLYTLRKLIGNTIGKHAKENQLWDKKVTAGLERGVQLAIDDAIENAGGTGWKAYLKSYSDRLGAIDKHNERLVATKKVAAQVKGSPGANLTSGEIPQAPTLLSRPMMLLNYGIKMLGQSANDPVVAKLTESLKDPRAFAELMARPATDPLKQRAMQVIQKATVATAMMERNNGT